MWTQPIYSELSILLAEQKAVVHRYKEWDKFLKFYRFLKVLVT